MLYSHLLHGITCKFLDMKVIYHSFDFREAMSHYLTHTVGQVQGDLLYVVPLLFIYLLQYLADLQGLGTRTNSDETSLPAVSVPIGHYRIELAIGLGCLIYSYALADIILKQKPPLCMGQLFPGPVTT